MRSLIIVLALVFTASVAQAEGTYFSWVTDDGVFSYTDDVKRVPVKYKEAAKELPFPKLVEYERFTSMVKGVPAEQEAALTARLETFRSVTVAARPAPEDCGTVSLRSERRDVDGFNRRFYIAEDSCGVLFDAPFYPDFQVNR